MAKRKINLLLVINNKKTLEEALNFLAKKKNLKIEIAKSDREAIERLTTSYIKYDVAVINSTITNDIGSNLKILKKIKNSYQDIEAIVIGSICDRYRTKARKAGAIYYFSDPPNYDDLFHAIKFASKQTQYKRMSKILDRLHKLSIAINATTDMQEILELTCKTAVEILNVDHSGLVLFEKDLSQGEVIAEYPPLGIKGSQIQVKGIPLEEKIVREQKIINISNLSRVKSFRVVKSILLNYDIRSLLIVPILLNGKVIASFGLDMMREARTFFDDEIDLCKKLASLVGVVIGKVQYIKKLSVLNKIGEILSKSASLETVEILDLIYRQTSKLMDVRNFYIAFYEKESNMIRFKFAIENYIRQKLAKGDYKDRKFGNGLTEYMIRNKIPILIKNNAKEYLLSHGIDFLGKEAKSWVGAPLISGKNVLGVIGIQNYEYENVYDESDRDVLFTIASQAAIAIENTKLLKDTRRRIRDLEIVNNIVKIISTKLNTEDLFKTLVSEIARKLNCTNCTIFFPKKENNVTLLVPNETYGLSSKTIMSRRFKPGEGIAGWVFLKGESLLLPDARKDPRYVPSKSRKEYPQAMLVTPVIVGDRTIGVICANQYEYNWFKENDKILLENLAKYIGIGIERAIGLNILLEIGKEIISVEAEEELMQKIITGAIDITNTNAGIIYLISEDKKTITNKYPFPLDFPHPTPGLEKKDGISHQVIDSGEILIIPDINRDKNINPSLGKIIRSIIVVPLKIEGNVVGLIFLYDKRIHHFTETEHSLLETLASQAAIVIKRAGLLRKLKQRKNELEVLNKISGKVGASSIKYIAKIIYKQTSKLVSADNFFICIYDKDHNALENVVWVYEGKFLKPIPKKVSDLAKYVFKTKVPLLIDDWDETENGFPIKNTAIITERRRSWLGVPLRIGKEIIGVISIQNREPNAFNEDTQRVLEIISSEAAISMKNVQLIRNLQKQRKNQLIAIHKISRLIAAPIDKKKMFKGILKWGMELIGESEFGEIRLFKEDKKELEVMASYGEKIRKEYLRTPIDRGIVGWVARNKNSILVPDVSKNERYWEILKGTKSEIAVPILKENELIGVLNIENSKVNVFGLEDLKLAEAIADLIVVAIENSNLFLNMDKKVKERTLALKRAKEKTAAAEKLALMSEVSSEFAHKMNNLGTTIPVYLKLIEHELKENNLNKKSILETLELIKKDLNFITRAASAIRKGTKIGRLEKIDANQLLDIALNRVSSNFPKSKGKIEINRYFSKNLPTIMGERDGFLDTLIIIIKNSFEAINGEGTIKIYTKLSEKENGMNLVITIEDTGIGIPQENLHRIFDLFFTTKEGGLGYGLWRGRAFMKSMGGDIEVQSQENKGTSVNLKIPLD